MNKKRLLYWNKFNFHLIVSATKVVVVTASSRWKIEEYLRSSEARGIMNLLVIATTGASDVIIRQVRNGSSSTQVFLAILHVHWCSKKIAITLKFYFWKNLHSSIKCELSSHWVSKNNKMVIEYLENSKAGQRPSMVSWSEHWLSPQRSPVWILVPAKFPLSRMDIYKQMYIRFRPAMKFITQDMCLRPFGH